MATEYEVIGVITDTTDDFSIVSVSIDGKPRSFSFSKTLFYAHGIQCEYSMNNILEEGMEVKLCYGISHSGSKPRVLAVWLGDKPEIDDLAGHIEDCSEVTQEIIAEDVKDVPAVGNGLTEAGAGLNETAFDEIMKDLTSGSSKKAFDIESNVLFSDPPLSGTISRFSFDSGCIVYENLKIFVDRENFYVNGLLSTVGQFMDYVGPGVNIVNFDALKTYRPDTEKSGFTHDAVCVWVGEKPSVSVIAKSLAPPKLELLKEEGQIFYGKATKYHLPRSVLVIITGESAAVCIDFNAFVDKVPSHPTNGVPGESLITNYIKLKEYVQFQLVQKSDVPDLLTGHNVAFIHMSFALRQRLKSGLQLSRATVKTKSASEKSPDTESESNSGSTTRSTVRTESEVFDAVPFRVCRSQSKTTLLNCTGVLQGNGKAFVVENAFGIIAVENKEIYNYNGKIMIKDLVQKDPSYSQSIVSFDAVSTPETDNFRVETMWVSQICGTRPSIECSLVSEITCPASATFLPKLHYGKISSIPLHNSAIASVKGVPVLVTLESLVTVEEVAGYTSIEELLSIGDDVALNVEKRNTLGGTQKFYRAIRCWKLNLDGKEIRASDKIVTPDPAIPTWFNVWGFGEYYHKERILSKNDGYFVEFVSSKRPNLKLCLDLFEKGNVFVDGVLVGQDTLKPYIGCEIKFHVAHDHPEKLIDFTSNGMFVVCAWIGQEPSPKEVLKVRLSVPKGLVNDFCYEGVVDDFPLPAHAICRIGVAPVLVSLCNVEEDGKFIGVLEENLKKGDRIVVRVAEVDLGDSVLLVCNDSFSKPSKLDQCFLRNVTGTVVEIPCPTGKIQAANSGVIVCFELCHVRALENETVESVLRLKDQIVVGKEVRFGAVKRHETTVYRAFEVFLID